MSKLSSAARAARNDDELDVDYSERAGYLTGKAAAMAEWQHRKAKKADRLLFDRLRARRWSKLHPERRRELNRKADAKKYARRREENAALIRGHVLTCEWCGTQWCRIPMGRKTSGTIPRFCTKEHARAAAYARNSADPEWRRKNLERALAWQKANPKRASEKAAKWARKKRAEKKP